MLINFWESPQLRQSCDISFSYRASPAYTSGLYKRAKVYFPIYALNLPDLSWIDDYVTHWPTGLRRSVQILSNGILGMPMFLYDVIALTRLFRRIRPQILHVNNGGYPGALSCRAAPIAAKLSGVKNVVMVVNNLARPYGGCSRWLDYPIDRLVVRSVSAFVTGSKAAASRLGQVLGLAPQEVMPLHNGIASRHLIENPQQTRHRLGLGDFDGALFGVVALMERRKGHLVLLKALARFIKSHPAFASKVKLLLEGDGPMRRELEDFVAAQGLSDLVCFVGVEKNVFDFMRALDVLVLPSIDNEDFPNVLLEGMALGLPVIASYLAGTPEQVEDGATGLLVPPGDVAALTDALATIVSDPLLRKKFGATGRQRFEENFTAERAVGRYLQLYKKMTEGGY